eukprot:TRINITY_DN6684_c1_g1_i4.p2 TRINITY_DN6684_c1_g1~~TRINITY_DN6684_c1_g1_i4.p2  ORF type:complete len:411 (+),score=92.36 TRINITY_DN6684_c1_g1_i4:89-1321(+)
MPTAAAAAGAPAGRLEPDAASVGEEEEGEEEEGEGEVDSVKSCVSFDWEEAGCAEDSGHIRPVYVARYADGQETQVVRAAGLDAACPFRDCSVGSTHLALLPARPGAAVMCRGKNAGGQLGVGDTAERDGFCHTAPPLSAARVCAGAGWTVALRGDGSVWSWGWESKVGRDGSPDAPAAVGELPPVALLAVGRDTTIVVSVGDDVFAWGVFFWGPYLCQDVPRPQRIRALSGCGSIRLACGAKVVAAETKRGELLTLRCLDWLNPNPEPPVRVQHRDLRFPLRSLVCTHHEVFCADAAGAVWVAGRCDAAVPAELPQRRRAVRLAARQDGVMVLTEEGELWETSHRGPLWRRIRPTHREGPLDLVPHGGPSATEVVLAPDYSGGKWRLALFARIAAQPAPSHCGCPVMRL